VNSMQDAGRVTVTARPTSIAGTRSRLMDACREVEGLFLSQLMEAMDASTFGGGVFGESGATALFRTRRNQAIADEMGRRGELGLAQMLHDDLAGQARNVDQTISGGHPAEGAQAQ
jgi:Rod binding domain-containing protein